MAWGGFVAYPVEGIGDLEDVAAVGPYFVALCVVPDGFVDDEADVLGVVWVGGERIGG